VARHLAASNGFGVGIEWQVAAASKINSSQPLEYHLAAAKAPDFRLSLEGSPYRAASQSSFPLPLPPFLSPLSAAG